MGCLWINWRGLPSIENGTESDVRLGKILPAGLGGCGGRKSPTAPAGYRPPDLIGDVEQTTIGRVAARPGRIALASCCQHRQARRRRAEGRWLCAESRPRVPPRPPSGGLALWSLCRALPLAVRCVDRGQGFKPGGRPLTPGGTIKIPLVRATTRPNFPSRFLVELGSGKRCKVGCCPAARASIT